MFKPKPIPILIVLAAVAATSVPAISFADEPATTNCPLSEHQITSVTPYRTHMRNTGRIPVQRLRGAEVFVQAAPGLTAEWLQLTLARHIAQMRGPVAMPDCVFDVDDVTVRVESGGTGFRVLILARDTDKAGEVLRRARLLLS